MIADQESDQASHDDGTPHSLHVLTITEIEKVIATPDVRDGLGLRDRAIVETL